MFVCITLRQQTSAGARDGNRAAGSEVTRAGKEKDVEYKTKESKSLDKTAAELRSDRDGLSTELAAVNEYYAKLKERGFGGTPVLHGSGGLRLAR